MCEIAHLCIGLGNLSQFIIPYLRQTEESISHHDIKVSGGERGVLEEEGGQQAFCLVAKRMRGDNRIPV